MGKLVIVGDLPQGHPVLPLGAVVLPLVAREWVPPPVPTLPVIPKREQVWFKADGTRKRLK